jgi:hypothetical protein
MAVDGPEVVKDDRPGSRTATVGDSVRAFLDEHPDMAHQATPIAKALGIAVGSAKREAKAWRDAHKLSRLGPTYLQNVRVVTRTPPGTAWVGSPDWVDRHDNKLTRSIDLPPDGRMDVCWSENGTVEIGLSAPRGLTPSEVLQAWSFAKALLPVDPDAPGTLSFEVLRDGASLRLDGLEAVTLRTAESLLSKVYRHTDRRGESLRAEVRTPPMSYTLREAEAMLMDRRPLGRDAVLERLTLQVEENTKAQLWSRREILHMRKAVDKLRVR